MAVELLTMMFFPILAVLIAILASLLDLHDLLLARAKKIDYTASGHTREFDELADWLRPIARRHNRIAFLLICCAVGFVLATISWVLR